MLNNLKFILSLIFLSVCFPTTVYAIDITLQWTSNNEPSLAGYRTFYREEGQSYDYESPYWESIEPVCTVYDLDETKTYYFVVRAFATDGSESANSNEVILHRGIPANQLPIENINSDKSNDAGCFIATAAFGSLMEPQVKVLRDFRDRFLLGNTVGDRFIRFYYKYSPPVADFIKDHDIIKSIVRLSLLPIVGVSWVALNIDHESTLALMFFFIFSFAILVCFRRRFKE